MELIQSLLLYFCGFKDKANDKANKRYNEHSQYPLSMAWVLSKWYLNFLLSMFQFSLLIFIVHAAKFCCLLAGENNIGALVAIWAPVILVRVSCKGWWFHSFGLQFIRKHIMNFLMPFCRFILWILRYGMQYTLPYMVVFLEHFVA